MELTRNNFTRKPYSCFCFWLSRASPSQKAKYAYYLFSRKTKERFPSIPVYSPSNLPSRSNVNRKIHSHSASVHLKKIPSISATFAYLFHSLHDTSSLFITTTQARRVNAEEKENIISRAAHNIYIYCRNPFIIHIEIKCELQGQRYNKMMCFSCSSKHTASFDRFWDVDYTGPSSQW